MHHLSYSWVCKHPSKITTYEYIWLKIWMNVRSYFGIFISVIQNESATKLDNWVNFTARTLYQLLIKSYKFNLQMDKSLPRHILAGSYSTCSIFWYRIYCFDGIKHSATCSVRQEQGAKKIKKTTIIMIFYIDHITYNLRMNK